MIKNIITLIEFVYYALKWPFITMCFVFLLYCVGVINVAHANGVLKDIITPFGLVGVFLLLMGFIVDLKRRFFNDTK